MPFQREHVQFALIFLCVPIQYFIVQNSGSSESSRSHQISLIVKQITDFQKHWLSPESWTKWCQKILLDRPDPGTGIVNSFSNRFVMRYFENTKISYLSTYLQQKFYLMYTNEKKSHLHVFSLPNLKRSANYTFICNYTRII